MNTVSNRGSMICLDDGSTSFDVRVLLTIQFLIVTVVCDSLRLGCFQSRSH